MSAMRPVGTYFFRILYNSLTIASQVLAVYDYMKLPDVQKRLQNEIENVKIELSKEKLKHLVGPNNIPQDAAKKTTADLAQMWDEYMKKHILRFERKGVTWLQNQLKPALKLYEAELKELQTDATTLKSQKTEVDKKKRKTAMQNLQRDARALKRNVSRAKVDVIAAELKFFKIKEEVD